MAHGGDDCTAYVAASALSAGGATTLSEACESGERDQRGRVRRDASPAWPEGGQRASNLRRRFVSYRHALDATVV